MATPLNTIKNWFRTGLIPTQLQFWATWDSFWHKDESIPIGSITNLSQYLDDKADAAALEAHINDEEAHSGNESNADGILTGSGRVYWIENLDFGCPPIRYIIGGQQYRTEPSLFTLDNGDANHSRFDVVAVDNNAELVILKGVPSANPQEPQVLFGEQLRVTAILVDANADTTTVYSKEVVYRENWLQPDEWSNDVINYDGQLDANEVIFNDEDASEGFLAIRATAIKPKTYIRFHNDAEIPFAEVDSLSFDFKHFKGSYYRITINLYNGNILTRSISISNGDYGLNLSAKGDYLKVNIPLSEFTQSSKESGFDNITFNASNRKAVVSLPSFNIDNVEFVTGGEVSPGKDTFIGLVDTPKSYEGQAGKTVKVKSTEDGVEFVSISVLKIYEQGEVFDDIENDILRISGNVIYKLASNVPYTTNNIEAEATAGDWTIELAAPKAGLEFKDADGITQFSGSFALFEGFGFDPATKTLINPSLRQLTGFYEGLEVGSNALNKYSGNQGNRINIKARQEAFQPQIAGSPNPNIYEIHADANSRTNGWLSQLILAVQNGANKIDGIIIKNDAVETLLPLKVLGGINLSSLTLTGRSGSQNVKETVVSTGNPSGFTAGLDINTTSTSPLKTVNFDMINTTPQTGWKSKIAFRLLETGLPDNEALIISTPTANTGDVLIEAKGVLKADEFDFSKLGKYADDAAAAAGVPINYAYINSATGAVHSRLS